MTNKRIPAAGVLLNLFSFPGKDYFDRLVESSIFLLSLSILQRDRVNEKTAFWWSCTYLVVSIHRFLAFLLRSWLKFYVRFVFFFLSQDKIFIASVQTRNKFTRKSNKRRKKAWIQRGRWSPAGEEKVTPDDLEKKRKALYLHSPLWCHSAMLLTRNG